MVTIPFPAALTGLTAMLLCLGFSMPVTVDFVFAPAPQKLLHRPRLLQAAERWLCKKHLKEINAHFQHFLSKVEI